MATGRTTDDHLPKTLAQKYCLLAGLVLLVAGVLGFLADSSFGTADDLGRGTLVLFDVNGWHNVVHLLSGIVLLAAANTRPTAKTVAIGFGFVYGIVFLIGLIQGDEVLGIIPVNGADHVLHFLLASAGVAAGLASATTKGGQRRRVGTGAPTAPATAADTEHPSTR